MIMSLTDVILREIVVCVEDLGGKELECNHNDAHSIVLLKENRVDELERNIIAIGDAYTHYDIQLLLESMTYEDNELWSSYRVKVSHRV